MEEEVTVMTALSSEVQHVRSVVHVSRRVFQEPEKVLPLFNAASGRQSQVNLRMTSWTKCIFLEGTRMMNCYLDNLLRNFIVFKLCL